MIRLLLLGIAVAFIANVDEPAHRTTQAPLQAAGIPVAGGTHDPAGSGNTVMERWSPAAIRANVEWPAGQAGREGQPGQAGCVETAGMYPGDSIEISHRWLPPCARRSYEESGAPHWVTGGWPQAGGGTLSEVALLPVCGGAGAKSRTHAPGFKPPRMGHGFPNTSDYYPPDSQRMGEGGDVVVRACVGKNGFLLAPPVVRRSSGSPRLDAAALKLAGDGSGKYVPATVDGMPVDAWVTFKVTFMLVTTPGADGQQP
jgi:TonB family protein